MDSTQPVVVQPESSQEIPMAGFFAIGIIVNVVLIAAYFVWAYKNWGKKDKQKN